MGNKPTCYKCNAHMKDSMSCRIHCINKDTNICYNCDRNLSEYRGNCYHLNKNPIKTKNNSLMGSCMRRSCNEKYIFKDMSFTLGDNLVEEKTKIRLNKTRNSKSNKITKYNRDDMLIIDSEELDSLFQNSDSSLSTNQSKSPTSECSNEENINQESTIETNQIIKTNQNNISNRDRTHNTKNKLVEKILENLDNEIKNELIKKQGIVKDDMHVNYGTNRSQKTKLKHKISI